MKFEDDYLHSRKHSDFRYLLKPIDICSIFPNDPTESYNQEPEDTLRTTGSTQVLSPDDISP